MRQSRVRVRHAHASPCKTPIHAYVSGMHTRRCANLLFARTRQVRARVDSRWSAP
ncbi:uncharacterized protein DS421_12g372960 [Arachis hypogaea]|nr:uncharacterized protein DS421_12g372960 [Arachis hypogaea]